MALATTVPKVNAIQKATPILGRGQSDSAQRLRLLARMLQVWGLHVL
jgi:hypothetical protein